MKFSYLVLGSGRVGRAICLSLKKKNKEVYLWDRDLNKARKFCKKNKIKIIENLIDFKGNFIIFAIKDDFIEKIAKKISKEIKGKGIAIHTSGIYNEKILSPLKEKGWLVAKCHPIYSFSLKEEGIPEGLYFGVQGSKKSLKEVKRLVDIFKGKTLYIPEGKEDIYHLSLSLGSNFSSFFFYLSLKIFQENFKKKDALKFLFFKSVENIFRYGREGITGPHIRKDKNTIKKHKKIIAEKFPELKKIYNFIGKEISKLGN